MTGTSMLCGERPLGELPTNPNATPKVCIVRCRREEGIYDIRMFYIPGTVFFLFNKVTYLQSLRFHFLSDTKNHTISHANRYYRLVTAIAFIGIHTDGISA